MEANPGLQSGEGLRPWSAGTGQEANLERPSGPGTGQGAMDHASNPTTVPVCPCAPRRRGLLGCRTGAAERSAYVWNQS